jgi:type IX secretion system PorP/SprF family membrane protein
MIKRKNYIFFTKPLFWLVLLFWGLRLSAQDAPIYHIHSFNNQFFQNPSFAGSENHAIFYLTYHKQLIGVLPNSPEHTSLTFHSPIHNSNSSLGFRFSNFRRSFLTTTGLTGSYAFRLNFDPQLNHHLNFGLSIGLLLNSFDAEILTEADPAIINRNNNKLRPDGQFGISYQYKNLQLGASFPKLFKSVSAINTTIFETTTPFKNLLFTAGYNIPLTKEFSFKPLVTYRIFEYEQNSGLEINGTFNYKQNVWFGASYRERYGLAFVFGIKLKNSASVSYAYKVPNSKTYNYANPAHEIQIALHLPHKQITQNIAKNDTLAPATKVDTVIAKIEDKKPDSSIIKKTDTTLTLPPQNTGEINPVHLKPLSSDKERSVVQGKEDNDLPTSNYIVVGSFQYEKNAKSFTNLLRSETYDARIGFNSVNQRYYVFLYNSENLPVTRAELEKIRSIAGFEDAWILKIVKPK